MKLTVSVRPRPPTSGEQADVQCRLGCGGAAAMLACAETGGALYWTDGTVRGLFRKFAVGVGE